jgi:hypothetical protein
MLNNYDYDNDGNQEIGMVEVPTEKIPSFQADVYRFWDNVVVEENIVNEFVTNRVYFGICPDCDETHLLGLISLVDGTEAKLYVAV